MPPLPPENNAESQENNPELILLADKTLEIRKRRGVQNMQQAVEIALKEDGSVDPRNDLRKLAILKILWERKEGESAK